MHFGRSEQAIQGELLPKDRQRTTGFLALDSLETQSYIGGPIWSCPEWKDNFYPPGLPPTRYLNYYAEKFNCVELNSSFYSLPKRSQLEFWSKQVPDSFRFSPKLSKAITHTNHQASWQHDIREFVARMEALQANLGPVFCQFPEEFSIKQWELLQKFCSLLPKSLTWAIELRHPSWFSDHMLLNPVIDLFYKHRIATVITDSPGRRDALHFSLTAPSVIIRFLGQFPLPSDQKRMKLWTERLSRWSGQNLSSSYFFIHQPKNITIPDSVLLMQQLQYERQFREVKKDDQSQSSHQRIS